MSDQDAAMDGAQPDDVRSLSETARFFSVSDPTVASWIRGGCPVLEGGRSGVPYKLSLRAVAAWRQGQAEAEAEAAEARAKADQQLQMELLGDSSALAGMSGAEGGKVSPRDKAALIEAELKAIRLAKERRELVSADEVRMGLAAAMAVIRDGMLSLPDRLSNTLELSEADIVALVEEIEATLNDAADQVARLEGTLTGGGEMALAAE